MAINRRKAIGDALTGFASGFAGSIQDATEAKRRCEINGGMWDGNNCIPRPGGVGVNAGLTHTLPKSTSRRRPLPSSPTIKSNRPVGLPTMK
jgi:hypothetical protein